MLLEIYIYIAYFAICRKINVDVELIAVVIGSNTSKRIGSSRVPTPLTTFESSREPHSILLLPTHEYLIHIPLLAGRDKK
jgi:hypothetical protein